MRAESDAIDQVDAVSMRLSKAKAIADFIMECDPGSLGKHTLSSAASLLIDLLDETHDLIRGKLSEVRS
jgi:hypothetical protein